jgi:hypothetical protein
MRPTSWLVLILACASCQPDLEGTWSGTDDSGKPLTLIFGPDRQLEVNGPDGPLSESLQGQTRLEFETLEEVDPRQLYMVFVLGDSLRRRMPLGIYKIENGRLVICPAKGSQPTFGFVPFGEPTFEWPTEFAGDCFALERG